MANRNHGLSEKETELVKLLMADCESTGDIQAKLKKLFAETIEQMLETEMDEHLGYEINSVLGNNSGNSRNGYGKKTIISNYGECEISVPVIATVNLNPRSSKKSKITQTKSSGKLWQCMQKECPSVTLKIPSGEFSVQKYLRDLFPE